VDAVIFRYKAFDLFVKTVLPGLALLALWLTTLIFRRETILTCWE
jgi:hypothetical protein